MAGTKRRKIGPRRIDRIVPAWVHRLLGERELPPEESAEFAEYFDWRFLDRAIPGLPPAEAPEGSQLAAEAEAKRRQRGRRR